MLLGNKVIVAGIGGNFIPGAQSSSDSTSAAVADISAGYITVSDSVVTLHDLTKGTTSIADKIYIPDTGVEEPAYAAGDTPQPVPASMDFYKCSAVYSDSTWSGYKATWDQAQKLWQFSSESSYIEGYIQQPIVGSIYNTDCSIIACMYTGFPDDAIASCFVDGLIDQSWNPGSYTSTTKDGIACVQLSRNKMYTKQVSTAPQGDSDRSFSIWAYGDANYYKAGSLLSWGQDANNHLYVALLNANTGYFSATAAGIVQIDFRGAWHHFLVTRRNSLSTLYIDGVKMRQRQVAITTSGYTITMGGHSVYSDNWWTGYLANARIYNRALLQRQVTALYHELTPTSN